MLVSDLYILTIVFFLAVWGRLGESFVIHFTH